MLQMEILQKTFFFFFPTQLIEGLSFFPRGGCRFTVDCGLLKFTGFCVCIVSPLSNRTQSSCVRRTAVGAYTTTYVVRKVGDPGRAATPVSSHGAATGMAR